MFGKLIGGVFGFLLAGFVGMAVGVLVGHFFDRGLSHTLSFATPSRLARARETFFEVSFELLGYLAKSDGRVSEAEVAQTEALMQRLGIAGQRREAAIMRFKTGASGSFDVALSVARFQQDCAGPRQVSETLLALLIGMAYADGAVHANERSALFEIARMLGLAEADFQRLLDMAKAQAQFHAHSGEGQVVTPSNRLAEAYAALGVSPECSDSDVKRAYRKLMSQHHPDKLTAQGVPEDMMKAATEKAQDIQAAYELIKQQRANR
ncbi:MAG: co-chaperone DjlA [Pseudomonadota bacterium]